MLDAFEVLYISSLIRFPLKHSTTHALLCLTESIKHSIDNEKYGCGVFSDLQKAFDTVNHDICLLQKLEHYGVKGNALNWFHSHLTGRAQYVTVKEHVSGSLPSSYGVPQGSVLGPLLFLRYLNDLPSVSKVLKFNLFADDTSIYYESDNLINLQKVVNRELRKVRKWLEENRLSLNLSKTNYVIFHTPSRRIDEFIRIKLGSKILTCVDYIKYLGVLVDSTLNWNPHIAELSKKLARTTGVFFKIRHYVSNETLKLLYCSLFYSFISYAIDVWSLAHPTILDCLYKLPKQVIRAISFKDRYAHSTPLFHKLKIFNLQNS